MLCRGWYLGSLHLSTLRRRVLIWRPVLALAKTPDTDADADPIEEGMLLHRQALVEGRKRRTQRHERREGPRRREQHSQELHYSDTSAGVARKLSWEQQRATVPLEEAVGVFHVMLRRKQR